MNNDKPTYCCLSHFWGILTANEYNHWLNSDDEDITATPLRQALCDVLDVYIKFIDEVGDDWEKLFSDLVGWDIVVEDFYTSCVKGQFTPWNNVNIEEWEYWKKYREMNKKSVAQLNSEKFVENANREPLKLSDNMVEVPMDEVSLGEPQPCVLGTTRLSDEMKNIIFATLDMCETDAQEQMGTNLEAYYDGNDIPRMDGVREVVGSSLFIEVLRAKFALTGEIKYYNFEFKDFKDACEFIIEDYFVSARNTFDKKVK